MRLSAFSARDRLLQNTDTYLNDCRGDSAGKVIDAIEIELAKPEPQTVIVEHAVDGGGYGGAGDFVQAKPAPVPQGEPAAWRSSFSGGDWAPKTRGAV